MMERIFAILLCIILVFAISVGCKADVQTEKYEYWVKPGDTLWEIAEKYAPKGMDKREYIFNIKKDNGLKRSEIYSGMVLEIVREVK